MLEKKFEIITHCAFLPLGAFDFGASVLWTEASCANIDWRLVWGLGNKKSPVLEDEAA